MGYTMPQFYLVTFGKALEDTTVSSYAELDSTQVYIIVVDQEQIMYIWRGTDAPNRMKFISSRAAAQLRVDQGGTHSVQSVDQGQEPPNFHNLFGDQALPKPTHPPTLAGEMLGALDDIKESHTDENETDHEEKFVESISEMKTHESDELYKEVPISSVEDVPELSEVEDVPELSEVEDVPEQEYVDTEKITDSVDQSISYKDTNQESVPTESITSDNDSPMESPSFMEAERLLESLNFDSSEKDNVQIPESANTKSSINTEFLGVPKKTTIDLTSQEDTKIIHSDETELTSLEVPSPEVPLEVPSPEIRLEVPLPEIPPEVPPEIPSELITTVAPAINESLEKTLKEYPIPDGYNREFIISQNKLYTIVRKEIQLLGVREERFEPLRDPPEGSHLVHGYLVRLIVRNGSVLAVEFLRSKETSRKPESEASVTSEAPSGEAHPEKTRSKLLSAMQREVKEFHP